MRQIGSRLRMGLISKVIGRYGLIAEFLGDLASGFVTEEMKD